MTDKKNFLFEVSWEVCNKVGGIFTVIRSKLGEVKKNFGSNYCLIGPMFENNPGFYVDSSEDLGDISYRLTNAGITALVGRWRDENDIKVILVKYRDVLDQSKLLYQLWEDFGVDSLRGSWDYIEPVLFSTIAAKVIEEISYMYRDYDRIAHFHEWMSGAGLLYLLKNVPDVATVFTTHATILGRSMAGNGIDIYRILNEINPKNEANRFNVSAKHSMESAAALGADCLTTVSEITAKEAKYILNVNTDIVLPNGFYVEKIPDFKDNSGYYAENRKKLLDFASRFLKRDFKSENTIIISTSGRYEFHNKGIDLIMSTLGELYKEQNKLEKELLVFLFIIGGSVDMSKGQKPSPGENNEIPRYSDISTHPLWDPYNDPIVKNAQEIGLLNKPFDKINLIFIPMYLNGRDGVLNMEYYDAVSGCDLTIYPSYYEPWGYTPLESIAYSVPSVSSDVAGFGNWVLTKGLEGQGIKIIRRAGIPAINSVNELKTYIIDFIKNYSESSLIDSRTSARSVAEHFSWKHFFKNYLKAYKIALAERDRRLQGKGTKEVAKAKEIFFPETFSKSPRFREITTTPSIPGRIQRLRELAFNLWWTWDSEAKELFEILNPELFEKMDKNPIHLLEIIDIERLEEVSSDEKYTSLYDHVMAKYDKYLADKNTGNKDIKYLSAEKPIAYFSMEFGFHECMRLYSGGLGVLSGDYVKSASDMDIPLIGVGLLYKNGYFKQRITKEGIQEAEYVANDFFRMPLKEVRKPDGERVIVSVNLPGRTTFARVWEANVGRIKVLFLDTDIDLNNFSDRNITAKLYEGDRNIRLEQEILLGIGGVRLLENELKIYPSVYHINEGHSAFLILERLTNLVKRHGIDIECGKELVKASTVFTTHTPIPAGNEKFDMSLLQVYFENYIRSNNASIEPNEFYDMGHREKGDKSPYDMTILALKNSNKRNGVSRLHGVITRKLWSDLWQGYLEEESPILSITNGIHPASWLAEPFKELFSRYASLKLKDDLFDRDKVNKISHIPDKILWQTHLDMKNQLLNSIKENVTEYWEREGESPHLINKFVKSLNPSALTIGFARRFAAYKRALIIFEDTERLSRIVNNEKYPVQLVFAGKAHPGNNRGIEMISKIVNISKQEEFLGKIVFLENYNIGLAKKMVSGVDVWLNTPLRTQEASGTSGQKAAINGVINFSIADGWWNEGYNEENGWIIGSGKEYDNPEHQEIADSISLYEVLENDIVPLFYSLNNHGIPEKWVKIMKNSVVSVLGEFNTHRMIREYLDKMYEPSAKKYFEMTKDNFKKTKDIVELKKNIAARFATLNINNISIRGIENDVVNLNDEITFSLEVNRGSMSNDELNAETIIIYNHEEKKLGIRKTEEINQPEREIIAIPMKIIEENGSDVKYSCTYHVKKHGKFEYGVRISAVSELIDDMKDINLACWG
ncbi:alpha-glucan family phosphorylase [bacterium]|nr:alpha-glucan family phosphorylase [bacterium]